MIQHPSHRSTQHNVMIRLLLIVGLISIPFIPLLITPTAVFAAMPTPGILTPLITPTYSVQIGSRTGIGGICIGCGVTSTASVINSDITTPTDKATINILAGLAGSGTIAVQDTTNTYPAGYFAGFVISSPGLINVQLLDSLIIRTYKNGTSQPQEEQSASNLLNLSLLSGSDQRVVGFVTTKDFDEIDIRVEGLLSVATSIDVYYAVVQSVPSTPSITTPTAGSTTNALPTISGMGLPNVAITVNEGATTRCATTANASGAWSCTPAALSSGAHSITATATNVVGTSAASTAVVFTVDATAPAAPAITSPAAGVRTNSATPVISGIAEANSTVTVKENNATVCVATTNGVGAWSCTSSAPLSDGAHVLTAKATDAVGNVSQDSATLTFTVDTIAPSAPTVSSPASGGSINDTTPLIGGTAESNSHITISEGATLLCTAVADASGTWSCTPATPLGNGSHTLTVTATDAAGNTGTATTQTFTIDSSVVSTPSILTPTINASTNNTKPAISGTADANVTVAVTDTGVLVCTATANANGAWSCTPATVLSEGAHTISAIATNAATTHSTPATRTFTIDTSAPTAVPTITAPLQNSTLGTSLPMFVGNGAEANSTVTVWEHGAPICTASASVAGTWNCAPTTPLSDGQHTIIATSTDAAGNTGLASAGRIFGVDTTAPAAPVITSPALGSTTNDTTPIFTGTAEPGSTVTVSEGPTTICTAIADVNGLWTCTPGTPLGSGDHSVTITTTDAAGNTSDPTSNPFTIDPAAVSTPNIITPAAGAFINDTTPLVSGTADVDTTVQVNEGTAPICQATTTASGEWSCTPTIPWSDGSHTITAVATSTLGRSSGPATQTFMMDTITPNPPIITSPAAGSTTKTRTPTFTGTAEANGTVTVMQASDATVLCTVTVNANSVWICISTIPLADGTHTVSATATDRAGNTSAASELRSFSVANVLAYIIITGPASGSFISDRTPMVNGSALPNSDITLVVDPDNNSATADSITFETGADANGHWAIDLGSATPSGGSLTSEGLELGTMISLIATDRPADASSEATDSMVVQIGMRVYIPIVDHTK